MAQRLSTPANTSLGNILVFVCWKHSGGQVESITQPYAGQLNPADPLALNSNPSSYIHYSYCMYADARSLTHNQMLTDKEGKGKWTKMHLILFMYIIRSSCICFLSLSFWQWWNETSLSNKILFRAFFKLKLLHLQFKFAKKNPWNNIYLKHL